MAHPSRVESISRDTVFARLARTLARRLPAVTAIRATVAVIGAGILLAAVGDVLASPPSGSRLAALAVLAVAVVGAEVTVTFALLLATQLALGLSAALLLGLLSVTADGILRSRPFPAIAERAALLPAILAAGEVFARAGDPWQRIGMLGWCAVFVYWIHRSHRRVDHLLLAGEGGQQRRGSVR